MERSIIFNKRSKSYDWGLTIAIVLLLAMWIPVVIDKWMHFEDFKLGMIRQPLPAFFKHVLVYLLPIAETLIVLLLTFKKFRKTGMGLSFILLVLFTGYLSLALMGGFKELPCTCGSIIKTLSWKQHLLFNLSLLILNAYGLMKAKKQNACYQR